MLSVNFTLYIFPVYLGMVIIILFYNAIEKRLLPDNVAQMVGVISIFLIFGQLIWTSVRLAKAITSKKAFAIVGNLIMMMILLMTDFGMLWVTLIYFGMGTYIDGG
jgi:hypothetical protein